MHMATRDSALARTCLAKALSLESPDDLVESAREALAQLIDIDAEKPATIAADDWSSIKGLLAETQQNNVSWEEDTGTNGTINSVAFWNIDGIRSKGTWDAILKLLETKSPEVCVMTEVKASPDRCQTTLKEMRPELARLGYRNCYWSWCNHSSSEWTTQAR